MMGDYQSLTAAWSVRMSLIYKDSIWIRKVLKKMNMSREKVLYICPKCGKRIGELEEFSHDHGPWVEEKVIEEKKLCEECASAGKKRCCKKG